jgi:predicted esterase
VSGGHIVIDYEELHRLSRVWAAAARSVGLQALGAARLSAEPAMFENALLDPAGAANAEVRILEAADGPNGLATLAARLALDALSLEAVVTKERLVDDLPIRQLLGVEQWLVTAPALVCLSPRQTVHAGQQRFLALAGATVGYAAPYAEPILSQLAPSSRFRRDVATRHELDVDPFFGLPLATTVQLAHEGPGSISISRYSPAWHDTAPGSLAAVMARVGDLEAQPEPALAIQRIAGARGVPRYVVELPGMRSIARSAGPQNLLGAVSAMALRSTAYTRCVRRALDEAGVPEGAEVVLVGHSQGGIVAMDLASDPTFNGVRVRVSHVIAAGSPVSSKRVAQGSGTQVFSIENVNDIVVHLDAVDSGARRQSAAWLTYQFADDRHDVVRSHESGLYATHLEQLGDSHNPMMRRLLSDLEPYLSGPTSTTIFTLRDTPGS